MKRWSRKKVYTLVFVFNIFFYTIMYKIGQTSTAAYNPYASSSIHPLTWKEVWELRNELMFTILFISLIIVLLIELFIFRKYKGKDKKQ